jgi:cytochrome b
LSGVLKGKPDHWVGHNPAGSYVIYALLLLGLAVVGSGWAVYAEVGGDWMEETHDTLAYIMLGVVGVHVAGVIVSSRLHRENLLRSMVTGYKLGKGEQAILSSEKYWVILLFGSVALACMLTLVS